MLGGRAARREERNGPDLAELNAQMKGWYEELDAP